MPTDREEITALLAAMLHAVDTLDWPGIRAAFADRVRVDYASLFGRAMGPEGGELERGGSDHASWRIVGLTLHFAFQEGNLGLPAVAQSRVLVDQVRA